MNPPKSERRSRKRIPVTLPVSIRSSPNGPANAYTRDLSMAGIFLYSDKQILEGSELEIVLRLPPELTQDEKRWVCCQALVVRVEDVTKERCFGVAARIQNMACMPEIV
jgi:hypothetical protein